MCGRYTLKKDKKSYAAWVRELGFTEISEIRIEFRFNIAPSQQVLALTAGSDGSSVEIGPFAWGLVPSWAKDTKIASSLVNARSETIFEKPAFRSAVRRRRCLVLADGFYEWKREGRARRPYHFRLRDGALFAFAGIWESWQPPGGEAVRTCAIVTCEANALVAPVHDRMPVILDVARARQWIDPRLDEPEMLRALLRPYPAGGMESFEVSTAVNDARRQGPALAEPVAPPPAEGELPFASEPELREGPAARPDPGREGTPDPAGNRSDQPPAPSPCGSS